jgi:hypothetical protein
VVSSRELGWLECAGCARRAVFAKVGIVQLVAVAVAPTPLNATWRVERSALCHTAAVPVSTIGVDDVNCLAAESTDVDAALAAQEDPWVTIC